MYIYIYNVQHAPFHTSKFKNPLLFNLEAVYLIKVPINYPISIVSKV